MPRRREVGEQQLEAELLDHLATVLAECGSEWVVGIDRRSRQNLTLRRWLPLIVLPPVLLLDGMLSTEGGM